MKSIFTFLAIASLAFSLPLSGNVPLDAKLLTDFDSVWRYHDLDQDLGTDWKSPDFDDSSWAEGPGLLGYDRTGRRDRWPAPGLQTEMEEGLITYYLRKEFEFSGKVEGNVLHIEQILDDGAVYYLNGVEIARSRLMPEGEITHGTRTTGVTNPWSDHKTLIIENPPLRQGRNVIAVSLHNAAPTSSDVCLGARISLGETTTDPITLYLTWQRDPTTTMTIHWHTEGDTGPAGVEIFPADSDSGEAIILEATTRPMPFSERLIHTVEATGLQPDTSYAFRMSNVQAGFNSHFYQFRTMPATAEQPIRIAIGGDVRHRQAWMEQVNEQAMRFDPHFIVWGGDLAYADGGPDRFGNWVEFFDAMMNTLITEEGRVIPVIFGIGNHEVQRGYFHHGGTDGIPVENTDAFRESIAPYYYSLFAFPGHPGYGVLDFGEYLSIVLLDTDHSGPIEGPQTEWLERTLAERSHVTHLIPVYHVPAYPSVRSFDGRVSSKVREFFTPLFERHGVELAFENHDHAYKRTIPILNNEPNPNGIVYIGDGAWGVGERPVHDADETWYLERSQSMRHAIILSIYGAFRDIKVIGREGEMLDHHMDFAGERSRHR